MTGPKRKVRQIVLTEHAYVDRGRPGELRYAHNGELPRVRQPQPVERIMLTLRAYRSHGQLQPALQPAQRVLLRWGESGGSGMPNPEADVRETHYDPLPPDLQQKVEDIVTGCPWELFARKYYRTDLTNKELMEQLCISRSQMYSDLSAMLWYFTGRFEAAMVYG